MTRFTFAPNQPGATALRWSTLALAGCLWAAGGHAQVVGNAPLTTDTAPLGLLQAYEAARLNDASLRSARAQADVVDERLVQARAQWRPNVSFTASRFKNDLTRTQPNALGKNVSQDENYFSESQSLQIRQPLYRPALDLGVNAARYQVADAQAVLAREEQSMGVRVVESYLQVLLAQDKLHLLTVQEKLVRQQVDAAQKRWDGGQGIRTDVDEAQARLDLLMAQTLEAQQTLQGTRLQLQVLIQQPVTHVRALVPALLNQPGFDAQDAAAWMQAAEETSPEIQALKARALAAAEEVKRAEAGHKPTLDGVVQVTRSLSETVTSPQSGYVNRQVGLQLNVPLYAGGAVQSAVRQALAEQRRLEEALESVRRDLSVRVQKEWRGVTEGMRRAQALERAVSSADQVVVSVQRSFEGGVRTVLDVLNAEQQAQQARRDLSEARYGYVASRLRLQALSGALDGERMQEADRWFVSDAQP